GKITTADNADVYQVIVHTTPHALAGTLDAAGQAPRPRTALPPSHPAWPARCHIEDGPALDPVDAQLIACQFTVSAMLHDRDGSVLTVGRRSRRATRAIRSAVRERDGARCVFPGCESSRTDLHHIRWWSMGGETSADNLHPLCRTHHRLVHLRRYIITRTPGGYTFTSPSTGRSIGPAGTLPEPDDDISTAHDAPITPDTISQATGERLDLHYAIWVALNRGRPAVTVV
ncbi:MAG TPA: HNH endonuclease signature motif containing protein, partial [Streptosporangiaceae bacterium]|nr:HNH endonuclease signature motif containing protein [Streptosporangiaceae bacterium]